MEYFQNDMLNYYTFQNDIPVHKITFQYATDKDENKAALNFHLTRREEKDIMFSIYSPSNQESFKQTIELMSRPAPDTTGVFGFWKIRWGCVYCIAAGL